MRRNKRQTSIQLLNILLNKELDLEDKQDTKTDDKKIAEPKLEGGRIVAPKKKISKPKIDKNKPINMKILLTQ